MIQPGASTYTSNHDLATEVSAPLVGGEPIDTGLSTPTRMSSGAVVSKTGIATAAAAAAASSHQQQHHHHYHQNPTSSSSQMKRNSLKGGGGTRRPSLKYRSHRQQTQSSGVGGATTPVSNSGVQPSVSIIKRKLSHGNSLSFYGPTATTSDDGGGGIRLLNDDDILFDETGATGGGLSTGGIDEYPMRSGESGGSGMPIAATGFSYAPTGGPQVSYATSQLYDR